MVTSSSQNHQYTMSYATHSDIMSKGFSYCLMYNRVGNLVHLTLDSIKSAMMDNNNSTSYNVDISHSSGASRTWWCR